MDDDTGDVNKQHNSINFNIICKESSFEGLYAIVKAWPSYS